MTTQFNDRKQEERLDELHRREEEQLAEMLAGRYGVEYSDLTSKSIDTDALRLVPEKEARESEVAASAEANFVGVSPAPGCSCFSICSRAIKEDFFSSSLSEFFKTAAEVRRSFGFKLFSFAATSVDA